MHSRSPALRNQIVFPSLLRDKVERGPHAARFFLYLAKTLDLELYRSNILGTPPYCRCTLIAGIFYAMFSGHFESQKIIQFWEDSIGAQWILNGIKMPSYKTVERIINALLLEVENFFIQVLELCDSVGLIGRERTFTDGTKKQANASKHKAMSYEFLNKKIVNGKETLKQLFVELRSIMDGIEELTDDEFESLVLKDAASANAELRRSHQQDLEERQDQIFNIDSEGQTPKKVHPNKG